MSVILKIVPRKYHYYVGYVVGKVQSLKGVK